MPLDITATIVSKNPGWLPADTGWPELDALHEQHLAALRVLIEAEDACIEVSRRHDAEDAERQRALKTAARNGEALDLDHPDPAEREMELAPLEERVRAARAALDDVYRETRAELRALEPELADRIRQIDAEAEEAQRQARQALIEAERRRGRVRVLAQWFDRTINKSDDEAYAFHDLPIPEPEAEPDWAAVLGGGSALEVSRA